MLLSPRVQTALIGIVAAILLLLFLVFYGVTFYMTLSGTSGILEEQDFFNTVSTVLAGLVGGVVATALQPARRNNVGVGGQDPDLNRTLGEILLWRFISSDRNVRLAQQRESLALAYILIYFALGLIAALVLILVEFAGIGAREVPDQVKSLAGIVTGLLVPLARSFFEAV
jgi:uncharacterized membrane protein